MGKVYLAGPLANCTRVEAFGWRQEATILLGEHNVSDPAKRFWQPDETLLTDQQRFEVVRDDLNAIDGCDAVLANVWKDSIGTACEMTYATQTGKLVVMVANRVVSPFLTYHADRVCTSIEEACRVLAEKLQLEGTTLS